MYAMTEVCNTSLKHLQICIVLLRSYAAGKPRTLATIKRSRQT
jgi:hypothetical protein